MPPEDAEGIDMGRVSAANELDQDIPGRRCQTKDITEFKKTPWEFTDETANLCRCYIRWSVRLGILLHLQGRMRLLPPLQCVFLVFRSESC